MEVQTAEAMLKSHLSEVRNANTALAAARDDVRDLRQRHLTLVTEGLAAARSRLPQKVEAAQLAAEGEVLREQLGHVEDTARFHVSRPTSGHRDSGRGGSSRLAEGEPSSGRFNRISSGHDSGRHNSQNSCGEKPLPERRIADGSPRKRKDASLSKAAVESLSAPVMAAPDDHAFSGSSNSESGESYDEDFLAKDSVLKRGWHRARAEDGRDYYYNSDGETSWEPPLVEVGMSAGSEDNLGARAMERHSPAGRESKCGGSHGVGAAGAVGRSTEAVECAVERMAAEQEATEQRLKRLSAASAVHEALDASTSAGSSQPSSLIASHKMSPRLNHEVGGGVCSLDHDVLGEGSKAASALGGHLSSIADASTPPNPFTTVAMDLSEELVLATPPEGPDFRSLLAPSSILDSGHNNALPISIHSDFDAGAFGFGTFGTSGLEIGNFESDGFTDDGFDNGHFGLDSAGAICGNVAVSTTQGRACVQGAKGSPSKFGDCATNQDFGGKDFGTDGDGFGGSNGGFGPDDGFSALDDAEAMQRSQLLATNVVEAPVLPSGLSAVESGGASTTHFPSKLPEGATTQPKSSAFSPAISSAEFPPGASFDAAFEPQGGFADFGTEGFGNATFQPEVHSKAALNLPSANAFSPTTAAKDSFPLPAADPPSAKSASRPLPFAADPLLRASPCAVATAAASSQRPVASTAGAVSASSQVADHASPLALRPGSSIPPQTFRGSNGDGRPTIERDSSPNPASLRNSASAPGGACASPSQLPRPTSRSFWSRASGRSSSKSSTRSPARTDTSRSASNKMLRASASTPQVPTSGFDGAGSHVAKVNELVSLGFSPDVAREALMRHGWDVGQAADSLLE